MFHISFLIPWNPSDTKRFDFLCCMIVLFSIQLNKYETASYCFLLNQNLTWDCLLIFVYLPEFTWSEPKTVLNIKKEQL